MGNLNSLNEAVPDSAPHLRLFITEVVQTGRGLLNTV